MKISLEAISKRYGKSWVFKAISSTFQSPECIALLGNNGSGKSTLLRIIAGMQAGTSGKVIFTNGETIIPNDSVYRYCSFCAPGMELPEELTLREVLDFHFTFKKPLQGFTIDKIIQETGLKRFADRSIGDYSSGMRQRVKLAQAIFSDTPVLMLDEPCTNLDSEGVEQYIQWIDAYGKGRLILVASNDEREYAFCNRTIALKDYL